MGDPSGITRPIVGLVDGVGLDLNEVWIPEDQAYAHGGKKLLVIHSTHHALGFPCVDQPATCDCRSIDRKNAPTLACTRR